MAVKTFTSERLTSSDVNTYLTNSGLVYIKQQSIGTSVTSVTVTDAFSASFDAYKIIAAGGSCTSDSNIRLQLGSATSSYYGFMPYGSYASATVLGSNDNNISLFNHVGGADSQGIHVDCELISPYLVKSTEIWSRARYGTVYGTYVGVQGNLTSFTSFTISVASGAMTGGTIRVYGYRQA